MTRPTQGPARHAARLTRPALAAAITACAAGLAGPAAPAAEDPAPPTLREIADAIGRHFGAIESLSVSYNVKAQGLEAPKALKQYLGLEYFTDETKVYAFKGTKRYQSTESKREVERIVADVEPVATTPAEEQRRKAIKAQLQRATSYPGVVVKKPRPSEKISLDIPVTVVAFDGRVLRRKHPSRNMADVIPAGQLKTDMQWFHQDYTRNLCFLLPDVFNPEHDQKGNRLPDAFALGDYRVEPSGEEVDGHACVVVTWPGHRKYWLDPAARFAVRKSEDYDPETGVPTVLRHNFDLTEVRGVWLPKRCWFDICGPPKAPPAYRGKPLLRYALTVTKLGVNDVPDSLFDLDINPGMQVVDATAGGAGDRKVITYVMPADRSQLNKTIEAARDETRRSELRGRYGWLYVWGNVAAVGLVAFGVIYYGRRKRPEEATGGDPGQGKGAGS